MAQAQVDNVLPAHEFMVWHKKESLFIEGHCFTFNKTHTKKNGEQVSYLYSCRRREFDCRKSRQAIRTEDDQFTLVGYSGQHHTYCVPNVTYLSVLKVKKVIKLRILSDPTLKQSEVYLAVRRFLNTLELEILRHQNNQRIIGMAL